jgi:hypothetical protein
VKNILAPTLCLPWCSGGHLSAAEDGVVHISVDQLIATSSGRETGTVYVSIEQVGHLDGTREPAAVRVEGAGSAPMTPAQAMQLAAELQAAAFAAISGQRVTR